MQPSRAVARAVLRESARKSRRYARRRPSLTGVAAGWARHVRPVVAAGKGSRAAGREGRPKRTHEKRRGASARGGLAGTAGLVALPETSLLPVRGCLNNQDRRASDEYRAERRFSGLPIVGPRSEISWRA